MYVCTHTPMFICIQINLVFRSSTVPTWLPGQISKYRNPNIHEFADLSWKHMPLPKCWESRETRRKYLDKLLCVCKGKTYFVSRSAIPFGLFKNSHSIDSRLHFAQTFFVFKAVGFKSKCRPDVLDLFAFNWSQWNSARAVGYRGIWTFSFLRHKCLRWVESFGLESSLFCDKHFLDAPNVSLFNDWLGWCENITGAVCLFAGCNMLSLLPAFLIILHCFRWTLGSGNLESQ